MSANQPSGAAKDDDVDGCDLAPRPSSPFPSINYQEQKLRHLHNDASTLSFVDTKQYRDR
jgi:hypothetical protein